VVGILSNPDDALRLVGAILIEQDDEWAVAERHNLQRGIVGADSHIVPVDHRAGDPGSDGVDHRPWREVSLDFHHLTG